MTQWVKENQSELRQEQDQKTGSISISKASDKTHGVTPVPLQDTVG